MTFRFCSFISMLVMFLALVSRAQQVQPTSAAQPDAGPSSTEANQCFMPAPDVEPTTGSAPVATNSKHRRKKKSGTQQVTEAEGANNLANKITVDVSKPFPSCAAIASSIDPKNPKLSSTIDGDSKVKIGSPECLLEGAANGNFYQCGKAPKEEKSRARSNKENVDLDYVIINLVKWSPKTKKP